MLRCPACRSHKHVVRNSRTRPGTIRRLRGCLSCDERWVTYEVSEAAFAALTDLDSLLHRVGKAIACSAAVVEDARGEGLLIQHDFDLRPADAKRRKRGRALPAGGEAKACKQTSPPSPTPRCNEGSATTPKLETTR